MGVLRTARPTAVRGRSWPFGGLAVVLAAAVAAAAVAWYTIPPTGRAAPAISGVAAQPEPGATAYTGHQDDRTTPDGRNAKQAVSQSALVVVYELTGAGGARNLTYVGEGGSLRQQDEVATPWAVSVQRAAAADAPSFSSLVAQNVGDGELGCRIRVNGAVVAQQSVTGVGARLSCVS
ncbi:MmpS family membrane protein [Amycolatopsis sulphurea]|uniref:MmpS family membrane protein n=1 Tax=Amycolatopsis sulphurea TaxID=76022 RepID=A0A2A9FK01_9PSEU|nr:MmpS family transport accessory protein [Amycolatopsis sulphurea]PFG50779.1 MmpS family membrane protein [Amycolatopsis sulphurea]